MIKIICFLILYVSLAISSDNVGVPNWYLTNSKVSQVSVCIPIDNSLQNNTKVSVKTTTIIKSSEINSKIRNEVSMVTNQSSDGIIKHCHILESGIYILGSKKNYCILYGK